MVTHGRSAARLYALSARLSALVVSTAGALLGLFAPTSLTAQVHDRLDQPMDYLNASVLIVAAVGFADVLWHDIRGRLIWPTLDPNLRHRICVLVYSFFCATWLLKVFVASFSVGILTGATVLVVFALAMSAVAGMVAVAIALEER